MLQAHQKLHTYVSHGWYVLRLLLIANLQCQSQWLFSFCGVFPSITRWVLELLSTRLEKWGRWYHIHSFNKKFRSFLRNIQQVGLVSQWLGPYQMTPTSGQSVCIPEHFAALNKIGVLLTTEKREKG